MLALHLPVLWSHLGPGFYVTVSTPDSTWAVAGAGACTLDMSQFNPSGTADSGLLTAPVVGTKCFHTKLR